MFFISISKNWNHVLQQAKPIFITKTSLLMLLWWKFYLAIIRTPLCRQNAFFDVTWRDVTWYIWYMIWYIWWYMIWYMIYGMINDDIWYDIYDDIWYDKWWYIWYDIFNCNWVDTRWQLLQYTFTNKTQNNTIDKNNTQNNTICVTKSYETYSPQCHTGRLNMSVECDISCFWRGYAVLASI
jgi:hypothetical protein